MQHTNTVSFRVWGKFALFSDPITRVGGEKYSYPIPTYQALKGILESCYWKPTFYWIIDRVRIINPIRTQSKGIRPIKYNNGENNLSIYTYLENVDYQVEAHFEWNDNRPDLICDRNENKHYFIAKRMIEKGGRRDIFLGTRECQGYIEPCVFGEGPGAYDQTQELCFGMMMHGLSYPDETGGDGLQVRLWQPVMNKGVISFVRPEECPIRRPIRKMAPKLFVPGQNMAVCDSLAQEEGWG